MGYSLAVSGLAIYAARGNLASLRKQHVNLTVHTSHNHNFHLKKSLSTQFRKSSTVCSLAESTPTSSADTLVTDLLQLVRNTDAGAEAEESKKKAAEAIVESLEKLGQEEPLKDPLIFGDWAVVYTSSPTAAGGYYRSLIGRLVLKTTELVQSIGKPNSVGNKVAFQAFNFLPGKVTLEGKFTPLDNKWVEVVFEPPTINLGGIKFNYGGESKVRLSTIYLDRRVRIGKGSRGSIFVFERI